MLENRLVRALSSQASFEASGLSLTTADRSFGAALSGAIERGELGRSIRLELRGSAGQSFGAFATQGLTLRLVGQANDYVGKGLSGGTVIVAPEPDLAALARTAAIAGNACLYGATGGRLHLVGRAGMRFAVRNSGAEAVVEGIGPHGCEYMTGGTVAVLGPVGANFGAGMTGGRAYLYDPPGRHVAALHEPSVRARRLADVVADRPDGAERLAEWRRLLEAHRDAGSALAATIMRADPGEQVWLVEPAVPAEAAVADTTAGSGTRASSGAPIAHSVAGVAAPAARASGA
jgi:glutamate synthase domain-containing protein 3